MTGRRGDFGASSERLVLKLMRAADAHLTTQHACMKASVYRFAELYHPTPVVAAIWCQTEGAYSGSCEQASVSTIHDSYVI